MKRREVLLPDGDVATLSSGPCFEDLETRLLMNAAPIFATALDTKFIIPEASLSRIIGVNGYDADGDPLTITAVSDNPNVAVSVNSTNNFVAGQVANSYAVLHFVDSAGAPMGDVVMQLLDNISPTATERFKYLAQNDPIVSATGDPFHADGTPYYTNVNVHRVIKDFMIQTGDAQNGDGTGGTSGLEMDDGTPLGAFADSFDPVAVFCGPGTLAMANSGPDTNDSQFFITTVATPWLTGKHMIFGQVISGYSVVDTIQNLATDQDNKPTNMPKLASVEIIDAASNLHDGTVEIVTGAGFTGTGHVTITLDDGNGGVVTKVISVHRLPTMTISTDVVSMASGGSTVLSPTFTNIDAGMLRYTLTSGVQTAVATANATTNTINLTMPTGFSGVMNLSVQAVLDGWSYGQSLGGMYTIVAQSPTDPTYLSRVSDTYQDQSGLASAISGNILYMAMGSSGLQLFDISDPSHPQALGRYVTSAGAGQYASYYSVRDVKVSGTRAYVADTWGGVAVFDVSNTASPQFLGRAGAYNGVTVSTPALALALGANNMIWTASYADGLVSYNATDPTAMTRNVINAAGTPSFTGAVTIAIKGDYAFVGDAGSYPQTPSAQDPTVLGQILIFNIHDPANVTYVGKIQTGQYPSPYGFAVDGNRLYVADQNSGFQIYNIADPVHPGLLSQLGMNCAQVSVSGGLAIVSAYRAFHLVNVSNPANPVIDYTFNAVGWGGLPAAGNGVLALPTASDGVMLLSTPQTITNGSVTFNDADGHPVTVAVASGTIRILLSDGDSGNIDRIDVLNGSAATKVSILNVNAGQKIAFTGDVVIQGKLGTLVLGNVSGGSHTLTYSGATATTSYKLSLGDVDSLTLDSKNPLVSLTAGQDSGMDLIVAGSIGTFTAKSWTGNVTARSITTLNVTGQTTPSLINGDFVGDITLTGALTTAKIAGMASGLWRAGSMGTLTAGRTTAGFNAQITGAVTTVTVANAAMGSLSAASISGINVGQGIGFAVTAANTIGTITAKSWSNGSITAKSLTRLAVTGAPGISGDFSGTLTLTPANPATYALTTAKVVGNLSGTWTLQGLAGTLTLGNVTGADVNVTGALGATTATSWVAGTIDAASIKSLNLGNVTTATITSAGSIGPVTAVAWANGAINAATVTSLSINGAVGVAGDFSADLTITPALATTLALGSAKVVGSLTGFWNVQGKSGTLKLGDADNWSIDTKAIASLTMGNVTSADVTSAGAIGAMVAKSWIDGTISATSVASLSSTGNFGATLAVTPVLPTSSALGSAKVTGSLNGTWTLGGTAGNLTLGPVGTWAITAQSIGAVTAGAVTNATVYSYGKIGAVTAASWADGSITAKQMATITTTVGNFAADVTVKNTTLPAVALITGINIKGTLSSAVIRTSGSIGNVSAGAMSHSRIYAGVKDTVIDNADADLWMPQTAADYNSTLTNIGLVKVLGAGGFVDSIIAGGKIGATTLNNVTTTNDKPLGLAATAITSLKTTGTWPGTWTATTWQNAERDQFTTIKIV